jgi:spore coat protein CotF
MYKQQLNTQTPNQTTNMKYINKENWQPPKNLREDNLQKLQKNSQHKATLINKNQL